MFNAGYDVTRLAWPLADLPVEVLSRLRADRVMEIRGARGHGVPTRGRSGLARASWNARRRVRGKAWAAR